MPHKRNPVLSENLTGLARIVRAAVVPALENVVLWHERDISQSSSERVVVPDAFLAVDYMLDRFRWIVDGLVVYPERMLRNLEASHGLVFSHRLLLALVESGLARGPIETVPADKKLLGWEYTKDFTPLIPRGIGITAGAASPDSAKLFMDFVYSNPGQAALCDAGFEASSNTFTPADGCPNTLKALYAAVGGAQNTYMTPFSLQVADGQAAFTARFKQAFHQ